MGDALPGHDEDGSCPWLEQFDAAARAEHIVDVHEYQTLKTVQTMKGGAPGDVLVDETPRSRFRSRS